MKFSLVFDNSGDEIPFNVIYNHELFEYFVSKSNSENQNSFTDDGKIFKKVGDSINHLHWAVTSTNSVLHDLIGQKFEQHTDLEKYLDQKFLNKLHSDWVFSHDHEIDIDELKFSNNINKAKIGNKLRAAYLDDVKKDTTAPALEILGYTYPFHEVNMGVHKLERQFNKEIEFKADAKWHIFENPFVDTMVSNNDIVNFSFGYTYVGRQNYNKFRYFDIDLENPDYYNFESLEFAFQINLSKQQTIPFSKEFMQWTKEKNIKPIAEQLPIANISNLDENLFKYRLVLFRNSKNNNRAKIQLL